MAILKKYKYVIIGAGPTGLGAAWRLKELGITDFVILERQGYAGGLAHTFIDDNGFLWDIGGHVQFSHYSYFDDVMNTVLSEDEWLVHPRQSYVYMENQYIRYPFQRNIASLSKQTIEDCIEGLRKRSPGPLANFRDWIYQSFGEGMARHFMIPYNEKVWAFPPEKLSHSWISERVATVNLNEVEASLNETKDEDDWGPNAVFRFPINGGTGEIWKRVADRIGKRHFRFNTYAGQIQVENNIISLGNHKYHSYEAMLSTVPLDRLCKKLMPSELDLIERTSGLLHSTTHVVGIGLRGLAPEHMKTKSWMYFPEGNSPYYRVTVFSNYSPNNVPKTGQYWSLMTETSESSHKKVDKAHLVKATITALVEDGLIASANDVVSTFHHSEDYGYPTPSVERNDILDYVLPELEAKNIYSRGRFGAWKYEVSNQDHSFMQGVEWVNRMEFGAEEETLNKPDFVNSRPKSK